MPRADADVQPLPAVAAHLSVGRHPPAGAGVNRQCPTGGRTGDAARLLLRLVLGDAAERRQVLPASSQFDHVQVRIAHENRNVTIRSE
jgi:hypothetical protein